jgi:Hydrazine synthase alpha subunit middle domain
VKHAKNIAIGAALFTLAGIGCSDDSSGPLGNVDALIILQRPKRNDGGDIFQYTSYIPGARLIKLEPPTADGKITELCCSNAGAEFQQMDIMAYDLSFDAKSVVFSGRLSTQQSFGLFLLNLEDGSVTQLATDPARDYVSPLFLPGDKIFFVANDVVELGAPQFQDEYERGTTTQVGRINVDGTGLELGARNLSHRAHPSLASDGRVMMTEWRHLGGVNEGDLIFMNSDMTSQREAYGREGTGFSNSYLKAREISPGRYITIATARDRTLQAGVLLDVRLGFPSTSDGVLRADDQMSEAHASSVSLTPDVPSDREPSANTIGRYYDAFPLNAKEHPDLLVSWADGPVESGVLGEAGVDAVFGVYLYDSEHQQRHPILLDQDMWTVFARPLQARTAPPVASSAIDPKLAGTGLIGSMNVYDSTLHTFNPGEVFGVRIMEGFSSEGGGPRMFGTTMFEGHANIGLARVQTDGSWMANVPANVPVHLQAVDVYGMSLFNEPVWISVRGGESRVCGGCHEDRAKTTVIDPGLTMAFHDIKSAMSATPRQQRVATDIDLGNANLITTGMTAQQTLDATDKLVGMAWDKAVQPMFNGRCTGCHDGTPGPANPSYQIVDPATNTVVFAFTFNLTATPVMIPGTEGPQTYPASYVSIAGVDMEAVERLHLMITGDYKTYAEPMNSRGSLIVQKLNPMQVYPAPTTQRAFTTTAHSVDAGGVGYSELTQAEFLRLILAIDNGLNYYARENSAQHD